MRPVRDDMDRGSAPLSGNSPEHSFWDHLGATRAAEYAKEDILDLCPEAAPVLDPPVSDTTASPSVAPVLPGDAAPGAVPAYPEQSAVGGAPLSRPVQAPASAGVAQWTNRAPVSTQPPRKPVSAAQTRRARLSYRLQRIWLTPLYRGLITRGLPFLLLVGIVGLVVSDARNRQQVMLWSEAAYSAVVDRPEFMVTDLEINAVAPELDRSIRARVEQVLPQSSFRLDLASLRAEIESYDSVAEAALRLGAGGKMFVTLKERAPVIVWHSGQDRLLLDIDGHRVARLSDTASLPDLPLVAGDGAKEHVREALALLDAAQPLGDRLRGLVRVGARRWDVVLDRDQRIRLPEQGAMQALERALALDDAQDLLARDVLAVDLRNPTRPILHVSPGAIETLRAIRNTLSEASQ